MEIRAVEAPNGIDWYSLYLAYSRGHLTYGTPRLQCPYDVADGVMYWFWWAGWQAALEGKELVEYGYWRWCWEQASRQSKRERRERPA